MMSFFVQEAFSTQAVLKRTEENLELLHLSSRAALPSAGAWKLDLEPLPAGKATMGDLYLGTADTLERLQWLLEYCGSDKGIVRLPRRADRDLTFLDGIPGAPYRLGPDRPLEAYNLGNRSCCRVAVLSSFKGFGDCLALGTALRELSRRLAEQGAEARIDLWLLPVDGIEDTLLAAGVIHGVRYLPQKAAGLLAYDLVVNCADKRIPNEVPLCDSMLQFAGLSTGSVPAERKRCFFPLPAEPDPDLAQAHRRARECFKRLVVVVPTSSTRIREIPAARLQELLERIAEQPDWALVIAGRANLPTHPRLLDWRALSSTFTRFAQIISLCDAVVSVDTSAYHLADAFNKPAVVFFNNNDGEIWTKYYPTAVPVQVGKPGPLGCLHFSVDPDLIRYADSQWSSEHISRAMGLLQQMLPADVSAGTMR